MLKLSDHLTAWAVVALSAAIFIGTGLSVHSKIDESYSTSSEQGTAGAFYQLRLDCLGVLDMEHVMGQTRAPSSAIISENGVTYETQDNDTAIRVALGEREFPGYHVLLFCY